eukprot:gene18982-19326_t
MIVTNFAKRLDKMIQTAPSHTGCGIIGRNAKINSIKLKAANRAAGIGDENGRLPARVKAPETQQFLVSSRKVKVVQQKHRVLAHLLGLQLLGRVFAFVTSPAYQARIAFKALDELVLAVKVRVDIGQKFHSATEDSLSRT